MIIHRYFPTFGIPQEVLRQNSPTTHKCPSFIPRVPIAPPCHQIRNRAQLVDINSAIHGAQRRSFGAPPATNNAKQLRSRELGDQNVARHGVQACSFDRRVTCWSFVASVSHFLIVARQSSPDSFPRNQFFRPIKRSKKQFPQTKAANGRKLRLFRRSTRSRRKVLICCSRQFADTHEDCLARPKRPAE